LAASLLAFALIVFSYQNCGMQPEESPSAPRSSTDSGGDNSTNTKKVSDEEIKALYQSIDNMAALDLSCQSDADCTALALGSRACGGPKRFAIVSKRNAGYNSIVSAASNLQVKERQYNQQEQVISICSLVEAPPFKCDAARKCAVDLGQ
jgi:hypothetical protein